MKAASKVKLILMWVMGIALFALRRYQLLYSFDSKTLLHIPSVVSTVLAVLVALAGVVLFLLSRWESKEKLPFADQFAPPRRSTILLIAGAFLMAAGGAAPVVSAVMNLVPGTTVLAAVGAARLAAAVLAVAACIGFVALAAEMRRSRASSVVPVLPAMFFAAFWVLALYLPTAEDPVLQRYYLPILAAAMSAYAFAELGGFFRKETRVRNFRFAAGYAIVLCLGAAAALEPESAVFVGCALVLSVFMGLQREVVKQEENEAQ